jgi:crotonobetainyl-CoA:carnitine CoA-transferase CaiB-like acyl-CoA transferase
MVTMHFLSGIVPNKLGNGHFVHVPYDTFTCSDGYIIIAIIADNFWVELLKVIPASDLDTEEHKYQPGRLKNKELINARLNEILSTNTQAYWLEILRPARIPCAPVNNLHQAVTNEQVLARNMIVEVPHPNGGSTRMPGNPIKLSDTHEDTFTPPPTLGQHNEEVFSTLGLTREDLDALQKDGVI